MNTVHLRVNDAGTNQPTPVRIRITDAGNSVPGRYYPPFGRLGDFATRLNEDVGGNVLLDEKPFAYIDGTAEVRLPPGPIEVEIHKGPEYRPIRQETALGPGKIALRFQIERWADLRQEGWHSGDTHAYFLTPHGALLEGAAEDLAVVNLLITEWRNSISNVLAFSGQQPVLARPGHLVVVNSLNSADALGSLALLNCHRPVYPLSFAPDQLCHWTLADWCDQCHRKGGLVLWNKFGQWHREDDDAGLIGETLAGLVLGKIDAVDVSELGGAHGRVIDYWYKLLNCGFRIPLTAGSGKASNGQLLGRPRTYARLPDGTDCTYANWIEAVRAGRVFVTTGPLVSLTVNGQEPGGVVEVPATAPTIHVSASARSMAPFDRLELVFNGSALAAVESEGTPPTAEFEIDLPVPGSGWLAARCWGNSALAHTSPIYLQVQDRPFEPDAINLAFFIDHIDQMLGWVEMEARFETDRQRENLAGIFQEARDKLVERMRD